MGWLFQKSWRRENAYKQATNLAGKYRELQIWNVIPEEQVQQEAFSFALPYVAPSKTRNTNLLMQTSDTAIKHLFYTHTRTHTCTRVHVRTHLTLFIHFSPGIVLEFICSSSHGRIRILSTGIVTCTARSWREQGTTLLVFLAKPRFPHLPAQNTDLLKICRHWTIVNIMQTLDLCRSLPSE